MNVSDFILLQWDMIMRIAVIGSINYEFAGGWLDKRAKPVEPGIGWFLLRFKIKSPAQALVKS